MKTITKLLIICTVIILNGCVTAEKCQQKFPCLTKDTTITTLIKHDTVIYIESDMANFEALLRCDSLGMVYLDSITTLNGKRIAVKYVFKDRWLKVDCKEDKSPFYISFYQKEIYRLLSKTQMLKPEKEPFLKQIRFPLVVILLILITILSFRFIKR